MTTEMKKVWFVDGQIIEQEIPESDIYKQEPVAWQVMVEDEAMKEFSIKDMAHDWCVQQKLSGSSYIYWIRPLYTTPPPCPTCEALARTVMFDQTSHDQFKPDWDAMAVLVEEQQRMSKRILELEALLERQTALLERQTARIVDLQTHIENFDGEDR